MSRGETQMRIRKAFAQEDVEASRAAHDEQNLMIIETADETHASAEAGEIVKSLVFGGLDGIVTTFAIVAAVAGAGLSTSTVILMGVANLVADGISMGLGDYLSETAERNFVRHEYKREEWEMRNYPQGEIQEMVQLFVDKKGFAEDDARDVMRIMAKYPKAFVDMMCVEELGFVAPNDEDEFPAWKKGLVTMLAFDVFGSVPVLVYIVALSAGSNLGKGVLFAISALATGCTMFALGVTKASITKQAKLRSGCMMLLNGTCAAGAAYAIGAILESIVHASSGC